VFHVGLGRRRWRRRRARPRGFFFFRFWLRVNQRNALCKKAINIRKRRGKQGLPSKACGVTSTHFSAVRELGLGPSASLRRDHGLLLGTSSGFVRLHGSARSLRRSLLLLLLPGHGRPMMQSLSLCRTPSSDGKRNSLPHLVERAGVFWRRIGCPWRVRPSFPPRRFPLSREWRTREKQGPSGREEEEDDPKTTFFAGQPPKGEERLTSSPSSQLRRERGASHSRRTSLLFLRQLRKVRAALRAFLALQRASYAPPTFFAVGNNG